LNEVWDYHARMVDCICAGDYTAGCKVHVAHMSLLMHRHAGVTSSGRKSEGER
jgi:hypothetical protein